MEINNNIQESYCSFEVSKLLKEKGFDVRRLKAFFEDGSRINLFDSKQENGIYLQPTHTLAIEWIRVNFGIDISVQPRRKHDFSKVYIYSLHENGGESKISEGFNSPQEATEVALLYVLNNLI